MILPSLRRHAGVTAGAPIIFQKKSHPQDRWDTKAGLKFKTYKINAEVAAEFQATCRRLGVAMGTELTKMMQQFINEHKQD